MGKIFFLIGKSATGKDTFYDKLSKNPELNLKTVIGYTTRPIRMKEQDGREYYFVTVDRLEQLRNEKKVIEERSYHTIHGIWYYFTVDDGQINLQNGNYLYIGTLESYEQVVKYFGKENVVPIYIEVENGLRLERALIRERKQDIPKYQEMCRRFLADEEDFSEEYIKKAAIEKRYENNDFDRCLEEIVETIMGYIH